MTKPSSRSPHFTLTRAARTLVAGLAVFACERAGTLAVSAQQPPPAAGASPVSIRFQATMGETPASCTTAFDGIGTTRSSVKIQDLKFYVHNVRLVTASGAKVPVQLEQDGRWQLDDVAMLDFEDGTGTCANGSKDVRTVVTGQVPSGSYVGLEFTLGVPFEKNHRDPVSAGAPLNLSRMFWVWNAGYKYLRFDYMSTGQPRGAFVHLGSTNCSPNQTRLTIPTACTHPNRVDVSLPSFDVAHDVVIADFASLLADANVDVNTADTAEGCMSGQSDPECAPVLSRLGLPIGDRSSGQQRLFRRAGPESAAAFQWNLPKGFPTPRVPADNPMTAEKVELGRRLFYDTRLSVNGTQACATCHKQALAFTDGRATGLGATGEAHTRGPMSLTNVAYSPVLTWGNPLMTSLERQALVPMVGENPVELGLAGHEHDLFERLRTVPEYQTLFPRSFPNDADPISLQNIAKAIAAFERTIISGRSAYDRYQYGGDQQAISDAAKRGEELFFGEKTECFHCHGGFNLTETVDFAGKSELEVEFHNTGLYNIGRTGAYPTGNTGVHTVTGKPEDMGRFRAPSLRNVAVTAPYMHDGSIPTLETVLDHYAAGGRTIAAGAHAGVGADSPLRSGFVRGFTMSAQERSDLIAFLQSLTDQSFLTDPRLADPWPSHVSAPDAVANHAR
ncbi:MAG: MbnH family di-heme enzyme [Vicinamibacterales bacterium]